MALAEAMVTGSDTEVAAAREAVRDAMGPAALLDAVGVVSNFERMTRIADATGIPLGEGLETLSAEVRADLDLDRYADRSAG